MQHLIKDVDVALDSASNLSKILQSKRCDVSDVEFDHIKVEAESFIMRCVEDLHRSRTSLESKVKREAQAGVLIFGDVFQYQDIEQKPRNNKQQTARSKQTTH